MNRPIDRLKQSIGVGDFLQKPPNMSTKGASSDVRVNKAVESLRKHPTLTVTEAMVLGGFTKKELADDTKHQGSILYKQMHNHIGKLKPTQLPTDQGKKTSAAAHVIVTTAL